MPRILALIGLGMMASQPLGAPSLAQAAPWPRSAPPTRATTRPSPLALAALGRDHLELRVGPGGQRRILRFASSGALLGELACGALEGAWGLWATDVNGDARPDLVIALRKKARFDPVLANRLHVYALAGDRCVPLWRGTRLAGRFERVWPEGPVLHVEETVGAGRHRLARYAWSGFGYVVEKVLWQGAGQPPSALVKRYLGARAPRKGAP